jgi:hypothetical protein
MLFSPASIAPGMASMMALSTTSMIVIEAVSAANASLSTARVASPEASSGRMVRAYPKKKASTTERATVAALLQTSAVPITMPRTSPMAQPVRQWTVAAKASRLSDGEGTASAATAWWP